MNQPAFIGPEQVRQLVGLDDLIEPVAEAFQAASAGRTQDGIITMYPAETLEAGDVYVKTSCRTGGAYFVVKVAPWFAANVEAGRPQGGMIALFDGATGHTAALIQDEHYLADLRTAATGAYLTRTLAPEDSRTLAVVGTGTQGYLQTKAALSQRPLDTVLVWGRTPDHVDALVERLGAEFPDRTVRGASDPGDAVSSADVVVAATSAREPVVNSAWLTSRQLVISVGSDDATKAELHPDCFTKADLVVVDRRDTARRYGNVHRAIEAGVLGEDSPLVEVGELAGLPPANQDRLAITTLVGIGAQDLAAAGLVVERWRATREGDAGPG